MCDYVICPYPSPLLATQKVTKRLQVIIFVFSKAFNNSYIVLQKGVQIKTDKGTYMNVFVDLSWGRLVGKGLLISTISKSNC